MTVPETPARTSREQFDRQAAHYNAQWNTWTEKTLHWLLEHADHRPEDTVLDVATGTGFTALAFAPYVRSVVGLDVSPGMLAEARQKQEAQGCANVTWIEGAAEAMPFPNASFSLVTTRVAPHHFLSIPQFLAEVKRVLVPGGRFLLADTCAPNDNPIAADWQNHVEALRDPSHARNLSPHEWRRALEEAGLTVQELSDPVGDVAITLNDWMVKAGCTLGQETQVRHAFATAPPEAVYAFQVRPAANDVEDRMKVNMEIDVETNRGNDTKSSRDAIEVEDYAFVWQRVVAKAINIKI